MKVNIKVKYPDNVQRAIEDIETAAKMARNAWNIIQSSIIVEQIPIECAPECTKPIGSLTLEIKE